MVITHRYLQNTPLYFFHSNHSFLQGKEATVKYQYYRSEKLKWLSEFSCYFNFLQTQKQLAAIS